MAKMKLKKPILLQEEFAAGEVSNPNQNAAPSVQTNTNTVGIDKHSWYQNRRRSESGNRKGC